MMFIKGGLRREWRFLTRLFCVQPHAKPHLLGAGLFRPESALRFAFRLLD